eukprot:COSAG03_NODE_1910_length_3365_cov_19.062156_2_plen_86_part_00
MYSVLCLMYSWACQLHCTHGRTSLLCDRTAATYTTALALAALKKKAVRGSGSGLDWAAHTQHARSFCVCLTFGRQLQTGGRLCRQ